MVQLHGAETIAAVIVEPVAGSTGLLLPPRGYLERLRELATRHGILLIFDKVITGFGRLGTPFAADYFGVAPDILTSARGLTNGVVPMGAVFCSRTIHDAMMQEREEAIDLFHAYTYSGVRPVIIPELDRLARIPPNDELGPVPFRQFLPVPYVYVERVLVDPLRVPVVWVALDLSESQESEI